MTETSVAIQPQIDALCRRVRWRLKIQAALRYGTYTTAAGLGLAAALVWLDRLRLVDLPEPGLVGLAAAGVAAVGIIAGLLRRVDSLEAAARLDRAGNLHDRLGSAVWFLRQDARTPLMEAAIRDAATHVGAADPKLAAPWRRPVGLGWLAAAAVLLSVGWFVVWQTGEAEGRALPMLSFEDALKIDKAMLTKADAEQLEDQAKELEREAAKAQDPRVKQWIAELNELVRALQEGRITPSEAHARMARLDKAREQWSKETGQEDMRAVADELEQAAKAVKKPHKATSPMLDALRKKAWDDAARAMERLADRLDKKDNDLSKKDRKKIARDMERVAKSLETERQRQRDRLRKDRDRLKKKEKKQRDRFSKRDRDRLKKKERELERLERERQADSEMRRQLERLQRGMSKSAKEMLRRLAEQSQPMSAEQMRQAAELMRRMSQQQQGRKQMRVATMKLDDLKELMRRAGKRGQSGRGSQGQDKFKKGRMERFLRLAEGEQEGKPGGQGKPGDQGKGGEKQGEDVTLLMPGGKGAKKMDLILPGMGGESPGMGGGLPGEGQGGGDASLGDGIGEGHDPNLLGERTSNKVKTVEDRVQGQEGAGPQESRVVYAAASKGFASRSYRAVHQDYEGVVEDALERQEIPAGQRRYVRRYFELIRPR